MTLESESIKLRENFSLSNVAIEPFLILIRESTKKTTIEMETCSGKQAIQSGGATMTLFGIMGKRWEHRNHVAKHYNEHWIRPKSKIKGYEKIDQGAYW